MSIHHGGAAGVGQRKPYVRRYLISLLVIAAALAGVLGGSVARADLATSVVYDAVPSSLPPNMASLGFQATQTSEFGDYVHLAGATRALRTVTVTMSDWALYSDYSSDSRYSGNNASWSHPITVNVYSNHLGANGVPDTLLGTKTQNVTIPWRPQANPGTNTGQCGAGSTRWFDSGTQACYNGRAFNATFDMSSLNLTLPNDVIVGVAYNTQSYGAAPLGVAGPYNSLNVGVEGSATVGTDDNIDRVFWNTSTASNYTDHGTGGVGSFREDTAWGIPAVSIAEGTIPIQITVAAPAPSDVYINPTFTGTADPDGSGPARQMGYDAFTTIQAGVNAVASTGTVHVAAGTYTEQVVVGKNLTLTGAGSGTTTIQAPGVLTNDPDGAKTLVLFTGSVNAELSGFTIQGPVNGLNFGIYVRAGATANVHDNIIANIRDNPLSGAQQGKAIEVGKYLDSGITPAVSQTGTATITNNVIYGYQKNGISVENTGSSATITGNTITGAGSTSVTAQNGIQIRRGATGNITTNTVTGNAYDGPTYSALGIGVTYAGAGVVIQGNIVNHNSANIYCYGSDGVHVLDNQVSDSSPVDQNAVAGITVQEDDAASASVGLTGILVSGNTVQNNLSGASTMSDGIDLYGIKSGTVSDNTVAGSSYDGILVGGSGNIVFTGNQLTGNGLLAADPKAAAIDFRGIPSRDWSLPLGNGGANTLGGFTVHSNTFTGNRNAIWNYDSGVVDATNNWFGSAAGPGALTGVTATPWCTNSSCSLLSNNADLTGMSLSSGSLSPAFSSSTTAYSASVANSVTSVTVTTSTNPGAGVVVSGGASLSSGNNTVSITVTSADATTKAYTVLVNRAAAPVLSGNADLAGLSLSSGTLSPGFSSGTTSYSVSVGNGVTAVTVTAVASDAAAGVVVSGGSSLTVGANTVTVTVTAADSTTKTHTLVVNRAAAPLSGNANLAGLSLSAGTLSPGFGASTTSYSVSVDNGVTAVTVSAAAADAGASVAVSGGSSLSVGNNTVTVTVTAVNNSVKTYTVTIVRAAAPLAGATTSVKAAPEQSGVASVVLAPTASAAGATTTPAPPVSIDVSWPANTFVVPVEVKVAPQETPAPPAGGGATPPPAPVAGGFSVGSSVVQLTVTDTNTGAAITSFQSPIKIHLSAIQAGDTPAYSHDGVTWTTIPQLSSPELPSGQQDGYFLNTDGSVDIYTLHATLFGLLNDSQAPNKPGVKAHAGGKKLYLTICSKDNVRVTGYRVTLNGHVVKSTLRTYLVLPARVGKYQVLALDAAGNKSKLSTTVKIVWTSNKKHPFKITS